MKYISASLILIFIVLLGFVVRLYRFDNPVGDWHAWRQADTSAVSRNFVKFGFDLLHPTFDDISNVPSGRDNPQGYRFVEFPIFNLFQAGFYVLLNFFTIEQWGRVVSIFSSLLSIVFIYLLVKKHIGTIEAIFSSFFFAFLPFSIYFGRVILPEQMMVMSILGGTWFFDRWLEEKSKVKSQKSKIQFKIQNFFYILAVIFTASAFLLKPFALFFTLPMFYLAYQKFGFSFVKKWQLWLFLILSILPLVAWRLWIQQYPEGIPASGWLLNANNIRFKGAFFYWIFGERISKLILGYLGTSLVVLGLLKLKNEKEYLFSLSFLASMLLYLFVIAAGNVQHDYYQTLIIPTLSIFLARGAAACIAVDYSKGKIVSFLTLLFVILGMIGFSWYFVRDFFNINDEGVVVAGKKADQILPQNAMVIAALPGARVGDTSFLYYVNRKGWPVFQKSIEELIKMGATHLVIASPTKNDFEGFGKQYQTIASSKDYLILTLK